MNTFTYPIDCDAVEQSLIENKNIYFLKCLQNLFFGHSNEVSPSKLLYKKHEFLLFGLFGQKEKVCSITLLLSNEIKYTI